MFTVQAFSGIAQRAALLFGMAMAMALAGCGGGSGGGGATTATGPTGSVLTGTAAAGAPIIGLVTIKDSSSPPKTKSVSIEADGKYTIDVAGMTAPFMMRADGTVGGRTYSLYSAATSADVNGTVNVTPLTDLIVANIAGQIAETFFASGNFSTLTPAALTAESTALRTRLQPILSALGVAASIDLLRSSFSADHSGLDAALDVLRVEVDPATQTAVIRNVIDNVQIVDDLASRTDTTVLSASTNVAGAVTEFQKIAAVFDTFSQLFATSVPASDNATLLSLFTTDFLSDGQDRAAFLSEITSSPQSVGLRFSGVVLEGPLSPEGAPTEGTVSFTVTERAHSFPMSSKVVKVGESWVIAGNRRIARTFGMSFARLQSGVADTGLVFEIQDEGGRGIDYAVVTGPGLPTGGALYVNYTSNSSFGVASGPYIGSSTPRLFSNGHNQYPLSDSVIATLTDSETYTIKLYDDNNTLPLATYTEKLVKRPYLRSELSPSSFAAITAPSASQLTTFALDGGSIGVSWSLPAGAKSLEVHYFRGGSLGQDSTSIDLSPTATSATVMMSPWDVGARGTLMANGLNIYILDTFGRELTTIFNGTPSGP